MMLCDAKIYGFRPNLFDCMIHSIIEMSFGFSDKVIEAACQQRQNNPRFIPLNDLDMVLGASTMIRGKRYWASSSQKDFDRSMVWKWLTGNTVKINGQTRSALELWLWCRTAKHYGNIEGRIMGWLAGQNRPELFASGVVPTPAMYRQSRNHPNHIDNLIQEASNQLKTYSLFLSFVDLVRAIDQYDQEQNQSKPTLLAILDLRCIVNAMNGEMSRLRSVPSKNLQINRLYALMDRYTVCAAKQKV